MSHYKTYALLYIYAIADTDIFTYISKFMQLFLFLFLLISKEPQ